MILGPAGWSNPGSELPRRESAVIDAVQFGQARFMVAAEQLKVGGEFDVVSQT